MERVHITKVFASDKKKDGTQIINKYGKVSYRVGIKTAEYGDVWINGFLSFNPDKWEGTEQELEISEEDYNGKPQKKFELPKKEDKLLHEINSLKIRLGKLENQVALLSKKEPRDFAEEMAMLEDSPFPDEPR